MTTALIVGSGPAAAGAALALSCREDCEITIIDIGLRLDPERQQTVDILAASEPNLWDATMAESISERPVEANVRGAPEKRVYGSDFPFRNIGQLDGVSSSDDANRSLISAAYGGFSNVWGSQLMPFTASTFDCWPISAEAIRPHYEAILRQVPFAGEVDDLARNFPLMTEPTPLPRMSPRSRWVLDSYERHRSTLNRRGITMGKARLAFKADRCVRCGLCMTGCPYGLIYSAAQTIDLLRQSNRITHRGGFIALNLREDADRAIVVAKELSTGQIHQFEGDRVYVACGAVGTTRLTAASLGLTDLTLAMLESQQYILPMLSLRPTPDPRLEQDFTLNQFNMTIALDSSETDLSQLHYYTFNSAFVDALPTILKGPMMEHLRAQVLRRLSVAFGYLPSWRSPRLLVRIGPHIDAAGVPDLHMSRESPPPAQKQMLRTVLTTLGQSARILDLYPLLPQMRLAGGGKSYHVGGSFPHSNNGPTVASSDWLGRVGPWRRIHLVDASVFPSIPAMTFTLTIMANAHRIASETFELAR
jgi:ferredoxin